MLKLSWTLEDEDDKVGQWGLQFFATFRLLHHFLGYFSSAPQEVSDTQSIIELMMLDFVLVGIHCFQRFCVVLHYIAFNNSPCLVNIHALLKLFNAKPFFQI